MSNFRWAIIAAIAALIVSAVLGMISGVSFFHVFIRAVIFAAVFFAFGFGLRLIINSFFPELLFSDDGSGKIDGLDQSSSRMAFTQDNTGEYAVPELYKTPGDPDELGNIEDLISGAFKPRSEQAMHQGVDQKQEEGYNGMGDIHDVVELESVKFQDTDIFEKPQAKKADFSPVFGDDSDSLGNLPDLDAMALAFGLGSSEDSMAFSGNSQSEVLDFGGGSDFGGISEESFAGNTGSSSFLEEADSTPSRYAGNKPQPLKGDFNPKELAEGLRTVLSKDKK